MYIKAHYCTPNYTIVHKSTLLYTKLYYSTQKYTIVHKSTTFYTKVHHSTQKYTISYTIVHYCRKRKVLCTNIGSVTLISKWYSRYFCPTCCTTAASNLLKIISSDVKISCWDLARKWPFSCSVKKHHNMDDGTK